MRFNLLVLHFALIATPALAQDGDFCADRPGLGTPACTIGTGQAMVELGLLGWDHSADPAEIDDDLTYGDLLVRVGLDDRTELQVGLGGYGSARSRDRPGGATSHVSGLGDVSIGLRRSLSGPGGPIALQAFVTLPTGHSGIGAGDWGAGLLLPMGYQLPMGFELDLTPELDAAVNVSGSGRHLAWGGVAGLAHGLGPDLSLAAEIGVWRDQDPAGHATDVRSALSLAWQVGKDWQLDAEGDVGLTAAAPRHSLMLGLARRF
jgi:hypothetical protein